MEYQLQRENPIAVFDSGVGGISVLRELIRTRQRKNLCFLFVALHQHMKLFFMNCHRGCHHKDFGMFHAKCRRFQCRFNPDNRNIRIHLAQFPDSSTGGCIAGNHKTFCPLVKQLSCTSDRQFPYFFFFFCSVWRIFRIPEINKIFRCRVRV